MEEFDYSDYGYREDPEAAREVDDRLVDAGDEDAISRKIYELEQATLQPFREFNDQLVDRGNKKAMLRKIMGLNHGSYGYLQNQDAAKELQDREVAKELQDRLIEQDDDEKITDILYYKTILENQLQGLDENIKEKPYYKLFMLLGYRADLEQNTDAAIEFVRKHKIHLWVHSKEAVNKAD